MDVKTPSAILTHVSMIRPSVCIKPCLLLSLSVLSSACSTTDAISNPSNASSASVQGTSDPVQPAAGLEGGFESIPDSNSQLTDPTSLTPPIDEAQGSILPVVATGENDIKPVGAANPVITIPEQVACTAEDAVMQVRMLQLINDARAQARYCGRTEFEATRSLKWNATLTDAARKHSADMATHNFFSHTGSDGSTASQRVTAEGYAWRTVGENIAAGRETAAQTVSDWLDSPGHCRNIMNPGFTEVSVTCVEDNGAEYKRYWTNVLAAPM